MWHDLYVCVSVCVLGTWVSCVKTAEPIEMPFSGLTQCVQGIAYLIGVPIGQIHLPPSRLYKKTNRTFAKLLWTLVHELTVENGCVW